MARQPDRAIYRRRVAELLRSPPPAGDDGLIGSIQAQSHWAKYLCVLTSGYLEQSVRELLLAHSAKKSAPSISRYVEKSWPISRNMSCGNISDILGRFDLSWSTKFDLWIAANDERKTKIDDIVRWRNSIAHGKEANTTGVTIASVQSSFSCACDLVDLLEELIPIE